MGSEKRQLQEQRVHMNESRAEFSDLDATSNYEVSVGTSSQSGNALGPGAALHDRNIMEGKGGEEGGGRVLRIG